MYIYRPHKGSLADALREAQTFDTTEEMFNFIVEEWTLDGVALFSADDLTISRDWEADDRCLWNNLHMILTTHIRNQMFDEPQCIGYCTKVNPIYDTDRAIMKGKKDDLTHFIALALRTAVQKGYLSAEYADDWGKVICSRILGIGNGALFSEVEQHLKRTGETFSDFALRAIRQTMEQDRTPF